MRIEPFRMELSVRGQRPIHFFTLVDPEAQQSLIWKVCKHSTHSLILVLLDSESVSIGTDWVRQSKL